MQKQISKRIIKKNSNNNATWRSVIKAYFRVQTEPSQLTKYAKICWLQNGSESPYLVKALRSPTCRNDVTAASHPARSFSSELLSWRRWVPDAPLKFLQSFIGYGADLPQCGIYAVLFKRCRRRAPNELPPPELRPVHWWFLRRMLTVLAFARSRVPCISPGRNEWWSLTRICPIKLTDFIIVPCII